MSTPLCQIAMSVTDLPRTHAWYTAAFNYLPASGTNAFKGYLSSKVQGIDAVASSCWWLMDGQDFFQIELFQFHSPPTRPLPKNWRPCDIGYSSIAIWVDNLDETLARLQVLGTETLTAPQGSPGERRVCVRDPEGVLLELFELDPLPGRSLPARADMDVLTLGITLSVVNLEQSREFFCDVMGLEEISGFTLHEPAHETLWGLDGAATRRLVLRAGDSLVELVQYMDPIGSSPAEDYRISDQGLLNIALGYRKRADFNAAYGKCIAANIEGNWRPMDLGAWKVVYVNDPQGFSVEMLHVQPWYDGRMGFTPCSAAPGLAVAGLRNITVQTRIAASKEAVFSSLIDHESMPHWWPLNSVTLIAGGLPQRNGSGAIRTMKGRGFTLEEEITDCQDGIGYDYRLRRGAPLKEHAAAVRILPAGTGVLVQWRIQFKPLIPGTGALCQWFLQRLISQALGRLSCQLESSFTPINR